MVPPPGHCPLYTALPGCGVGKLGQHLVLHPLVEVHLGHAGEQRGPQTARSFLSFDELFSLIAQNRLAKGQPKCASWFCRSNVGAVQGLGS